MKKQLLSLVFIISALLSCLKTSAQLSGLYQQDFEGSFPPASWQVVDVLDNTNTWIQSTTQHYSGTHSTYINYTNQGVQGEDWLVMPQFTVNDGDSLSFWLAAAFPSYEDSTYIMISTTDNTLTSFSVDTFLYDVLGGSGTYPTTANQFKYYSFSLAAYSGENIYVALKNRNVYGDGVYIDLLTIGAVLQYDAQTLSIDVPDFVSTVGSTTPQATVKNNSLASQSFPVTMTATGGYSSTINVSNLAPGASQQISFDPWTPTAGTYTVSVQTQLPGDQIDWNDTLSKSVTALAPLSGFYQENFEGSFPPLGWQVHDVADIGNTWTQSQNFPYSGNNSAYLIWSSLTQEGEDWLILPQFTVAGTDSFSFWLAVAFTMFPPDSTSILVSTTDNNLSSFTSTVAVLSEGVNYPTTTYTYQYYAFSLAAYAGQNVYVALKNRNLNGDGLYVDQVSIGTPPNTDAQAISIDLPPYVSTAAISPMATVRNNSITAESFPVTLTATGGYSSTMNVTNLAIGAEQQITFDPWTPVAGTDALHLQTQLAGDENPANDTISSSVSVLSPFINYGWSSHTATSETVWDGALASVNDPDGSALYVLAGVNSGNLIADANVFNPITSSWSGLSPMNLENYTSCAAAINGKIYVIGGYNPPFIGISDNQIYDISTDTWTEGSPMPTAAGDYAIGVYHDSLIYCIGGLDDNAFTDYDLVQIYDPGTDTWTTGTSVPLSGFGWQGGIVGNKIVVCGGAQFFTGLVVGTTYVGTIDPSNPANITWEQVADYPSGGNFRPGAAAALDQSTGLVIFTGGDPDGTATSALTGTFAYDVNSGSWKIGPDKITGANNLRNLTCVTYNDSTYLVSVGGLDAGQNELDVNEWLNLGPTGIGTNVSQPATTDFNLSSYPNPFSKFTELSFNLDHASQVTLSIVDVSGREVNELCNKTFSAGKQQIFWDAKGVAAGVYFCKLTVNDQVITKKLVKLN